MRTIQVEDKIWFLSVFYLGQKCSQCGAKARLLLAFQVHCFVVNTLAQVSSSPLTGQKEECETGSQVSCFLPFTQHVGIQ